MQKMYKNMFLYEKSKGYLKKDCEFFYAFKTKDCKIRGNCNLLTIAKFHKLEWSSPLKSYKHVKNQNDPPISWDTANQRILQSDLPGVFWAKASDNKFWTKTSSSY